MAAVGAGTEFETRLHPVVFLGPLTMAGLAGLTTMFVVQNNDLAPATDAWVILGGIFLAGLSIVPTCGRWLRARFSATERGFQGSVGWLRPNRLVLPWPSVADVDLDQTWLGVRLGYGTVRFLTVETAVEGFAHVARAPELVTAVRRWIDGRGRGTR